MLLPSYDGSCGAICQSIHRFPRMLTLSDRFMDSIPAGVPEFQYGRFWRLLERTGSGYQARFEFQENEYSTYQRRTHFT